MPMRTNADGSLALLAAPQDEPQPAPVARPEPERPGAGLPDWMDGQCGHLARTASAAIKPLGQLRSKFLARMYESAGHGHFPVTPTAEDIVQALSRELNASDEATKAALRPWVETIAAEAVAEIDQAKEAVRQRAESRAEWARQQAEKDRAEAERKALMERSEFDRQAVLAQEAEARKWAAFESQKDQYEAYKARTSAPANATA
jgi:hypothetical protein